jgi:hypothetical protein
LQKKKNTHNLQIKNLAKQNKKPKLELIITQNIKQLKIFKKRAKNNRE